MKFVNTQYFREAAIQFDKNGGKYTLAPEGSKDWYDFWREQERRCKEGYSVGGVYITGRHYFYLNFTRIQRTVGSLKKKTQRKVESFPGFWEIDYNWWWYKEIAWWGCGEGQLKTLELTKNPKFATGVDGKFLVDEHGERYVEGGKHLSCLKSRRGGFSYKEAADGVYNYNFVPKSINYYYAGLEKYLAGVDGILTKAQINLDWLNAYTDKWWRKNRMKHGVVLHQKASYIDLDDKAEKGFFSQIVGQVLDDPDKARGGDGYKVTFEEGGSFPRLKEALDKIIPALMEGGTMTGQATVFGTGGEEGEEIEGLDEIFNDPTTYFMLPFENDWEEGYEATECGVFVPCTMVNPTFMDKDGNIDMPAAIEYDDHMRDIARKAKDPKKIDRRIAENPRNPTEALIRVNVNNFPVNEARAQKARILKSSELKGLYLHGELVRNVTGIEFEVKSRLDAKPVEHYPHKKDDDLEGCVTMIQKPEKDEHGNVPENLYIITVDPFYDEDAASKTSLVSITVTKRRNGFTPTHKLDVCWFVGRPRKMSRVYDVLFCLADYWNAKIQSEIGGGGKGIIDAARTRKKLHRLEFRPTNINDKEISKDPLNRAYFMNMSDDDKDLGLGYYQDSLTDVVAIDGNGNELLEIHFVYNLGLLDEIIKFNPKKNADRISNQIIKQFQLRETAKREVKDRKKKRKRLIDRNLYSDEQRSNVSRMRLKDNEAII